MLAHVAGLQALLGEVLAEVSVFEACSVLLWGCAWELAQGWRALCLLTVLCEDQAARLAL